MGGGLDSEEKKVSEGLMATPTGTRPAVISLINEVPLFALSEVFC